MAPLLEGSQKGLKPALNIFLKASNGPPGLPLRPHGLQFSGVSLGIRFCWLKVRKKKPVESKSPGKQNMWLQGDLHVCRGRQRQRGRERERQAERDMALCSKRKFTAVYGIRRMQQRHGQMVKCLLSWCACFSTMNTNRKGGKEELSSK